MCNINVFIRKDGTNIKDDAKLCEAINIVTAMSFVTNPDAEGYFSLDADGNLADIRRQERKIIYSDMKGCAVFTHQRLTTSGNNAFMTHPHRVDDLILLHNGVFSEMGNKKKSDTRQYVEILAQHRKRNDTIKALEKVHKKVSGSYSCILYDAKEKKTYYYKDDFTTMFAYEDDIYILMSTKVANLAYMKEYLCLKNAVTTIKKDTIFSITKEGLTKIGSLAPRYKRRHNSWSSKDKDRYGVWDYGFNDKDDDAHKSPDSYYGRYMKNHAPHCRCGVCESERWSRKNPTWQKPYY